MKFKNDKDDLLPAMEEIQMRNEELKGVDKECFSVWMFQKVQRRRGMELFQYQTLIDVLKVEGDRMKEFVTKYREEGIVINCSDIRIHGRERQR